MADNPIDLDSRVRRLDDSVEGLRTEVTSLKLELATLISALREFQHQTVQATSSRRPAPIPPARTPSLVPAAIVVLIAVMLLSWQLINTPRNDRVEASAAKPAAEQPAPSVATHAPTIEDAKQATDPPVTPLVTPTVYKGTLSVSADRPGAEVFVNRRLIGTAPVRVSNLRAGAHLVWVERDGYRRWTRVVTVPAERVTRVAADLEPISNDR